MTSQPAATRFGHRIALAAACAALVFLAGCPGSKSGDTSDTTPPGAPSALGASPVSGAQINLAWTAATDDVGVSGYRVERCQGASCSTFAQVATPTGTSYNDTGLTDATSYSYRVRATDAAGNLGAYSNTASAATLDATPPTAPSNLSATPASQTQINLTWTAATDNVGVTGYRVERCQGASCSTFAQIATPSATSFNDTGLTAGTSYSYQVRAVDAASNLGAFSSVASATTLPPPPVAPSGVSATPGNAQAVLSWSAVAGASSYNVYTSPTSPVTTGGTKTTVSTPGATLSALTNGTPIYAAVTAVNVSGESPLSSGVCAVPTTASTSGVTLYDPLCEDTLDGAKWIAPQFSYGVASSAVALSSQVSNMEVRSVQGLTYQTLASVVTGGQRVSTLKADIAVPASTASRTGTAEIRAVLRLTYQPPANRLNFPGGTLNQLALEVGLRDSGSGPQAIRTVRHCDSADCQTRSTTGISITDPGGFTGTGSGIDAAAAASYDTTYTVSVSLDETTGILGWSIAGGAFGGGVSGTADPATYLTTNTTWNAIANPLTTGGGFSAAQLGTRMFDDTGGADANVSASFGNVQVGFNNAAATTFDDFSGTGLNSSSTELSPAKWSALGGALGKSSAILSTGSMVGHAQATSPTTAGFSDFQALSLNNPASVNTIQADVTISTCTNTFSGAGKSNRVQLQGNFYNDGTPGGAAPNNNQANSNVGDVRAFLFLDCVSGIASFELLRFNTQSTGTVLTNPVQSTLPVTGPVIGGTHTLRITWDPTAKTFAFQMDGGTPVVVDPGVVSAIVTTAAPFVKAANSPVKQLVWGVFVANSVAPSAAGTAASLDFKANNIFTAP
jgi:chitodextrinase